MFLIQAPNCVTVRLNKRLYQLKRDLLTTEATVKTKASAYMHNKYVFYENEDNGCICNFYQKNKVLLIHLFSKQPNKLN